MGRKLRCLLAGRLVEVTVRTIQGRFLLRPGPGANRLIKGTLGRAQRHFGLKVVVCVFMSNHYHLLVLPETEEQLAKFMQFVNTNLSKQLGRLYNWSGQMFPPKYHAIPVSDEPDAQIARFRYLLEHGVKEGLVERPGDWPGVQCIAALTRGPAKLHGVWHERTAIYEARVRGEVLPAKERITQETLELSSLPAWASQSPAEQRASVQVQVSEIEQVFRERRQAEGVKVLGVRAILAQDPHHLPESVKSSREPVAHAATVEAWLAMKIEYREFVAVYREAAERLKAGQEARFPGGCFPPAGPYIPRAGPVGA